ncbi:MAG: thiol-disulfide oxidoreductase DCC family protein [Gammaproteobacteria bacterium]
MQENSEIVDAGADHGLTVFYDGSCSICSREINIYQAMRGAERIEFTDASALTFEETEAGITRESALAALHVRDAQGRVFIGVEAFTQIWAHLPATQLLAKLAKFEAFRRLLRLGYKVFVRLRGATVVPTALFRRLPQDLQNQLKDLLILLVEEQSDFRGQRLSKCDDSQITELTQRRATNDKLLRAIEETISRKNRPLAYRLRTTGARFCGMITVFINGSCRETTKRAATVKIRELKRSLAMLERDYAENRDVLNYLSHVKQALLELS